MLTWPPVTPLAAGAAEVAAVEGAADAAVDAAAVGAADAPTLAAGAFVGAVVAAAGALVAGVSAAPQAARPTAPAPAAVRRKNARRSIWRSRGPRSSSAGGVVTMLSLLIYGHKILVPLVGACMCCRKYPFAYALLLSGIWYDDA